MSNQSLYRAAICAFVLMAFTSPAFAHTASPNTSISTLDVSTTYVAFTLNSGLPSSGAGRCLYNTLYIDVSHAGSAAALASMQSGITAAYLSGKPITSVEYTNSGSNTQCWLSYLRF